jgi:hypothetical protein
MNKRLPAEALGYYLNLGTGRSYQAVADHFGVSKRTVTATATRERWQEHLSKADDKARENIGERYVESIEEANKRHVKLGRFLQSQGVAALAKEGALSGGDRIRAIKIGVEIERLGLGEATERTENVEAIIRREHERWSKPAGEDEWADLVEDEKPAGDGEPEQAPGESESDGEVAA